MATAPLLAVDNTDEVVAVGTCRVLRARRIGQIYLMENLQGRGDAERWRVVAKADGDGDPVQARREIFELLIDANRVLIQQMRELRDERRKREAAGGADPGL